MEILRDIQGEFQGAAVFAFQSGGELFHPMVLTLALFLQSDAQMISVPDQVRDAVILPHKVPGFKQNAPGFQQRAVLQRFGVQCIQCQYDLI